MAPFLLKSCRINPHRGGIIMSTPSGNAQPGQWQDKAKAQDSAERKEDYMVLILAAVTVVLVLTGVIGPNFMKSLFF
jgi:hypothetical protein